MATADKHHNGKKKVNEYNNDKKFKKINKNSKKSSCKMSIEKQKRKELVVQHPKFEGIFINNAKSNALMTQNMVPGSSVYNEKRLLVTKNGKTIEYRYWNPYRSKLAAGIVCGLDEIYIKNNTAVLYLGAANGTTVSHVSEIVGKDTLIYAVEFSPRSGRDLISLSMKRNNIVPIIADARNPSAYRMLVPMVDTIFSDISQFDQSRIVMENAQYFLKDKGKILISIKASCVDSTVPADRVFANEVNWLKKHNFKPIEQVTLEPYEKNHALLVGYYKPSDNL
ncbi:fibrillarin [Enterocytozoon bieneusi H348]|nr:fibrillarin [Enterocytozoon bieneusi H348]|eukprot:XP_002649608.1 rRNA methyltransferase NOP1 [Enterocytozoon bieneusi H348]